MKSKLLIFLSIFFILLSTSLIAQEKDLSLVYELLEVVNFKENYEGSVRKILDPMLRSSSGFSELGESQDEVIEIIIESFNWESVKEDVAKICAAEFSSQEIKKLIIFYKSPLGKKAQWLFSGLVEKGAEIATLRLVTDPEVKKKIIELKKKKGIKKRKSE